MSDQTEPYNPLDKINLAESIAIALQNSSARSVSDTSDVIGAGVYAIYYARAFDLYEPIAKKNLDGFFQPIHSGRHFADKLADGKTTEAEIEGIVRRHLF